MANNNGAEKMDEGQLARGLGWFSIGLGFTELLAPRSLARLVGVKSHPLLFRAFGLREIASGVGILSQTRPVSGLQSRVFGDMLDLASLGVALTSEHSKRGRVLVATAAVAGVAALDILCTQKLSGGTGVINTLVHVEQSITINRSPEELYGFWHNFESLPRFMNHLQSVQITGDKRSHWIAKAPAGTSVEWDAEITDDQPNHLIGWRSVENAEVNNSGVVQFERAPGGRGTVVKVRMDYRPPGGALGAKLALLFGEAPEKQVHVDLHRFKQMMETGEIATTEGQPAGRASSTSRKFDDLLRK